MIVLSILTASLITVVVFNASGFSTNKDSPIGIAKDVTAQFVNGTVVVTWTVPEGWTDDTDPDHQGFVVSRAGGIEGVSHWLDMEIGQECSGHYNYGPNDKWNFTDSEIMGGATYQYRVYPVHNGQTGTASEAVNVTIPKIVGQMTVHFLNVGNGTSTLIQTPDDRNVLINAGGTKGPICVTSYLENLSVSRIDALVLSNLNANCTSYYKDVLADLNVTDVYLADNGTSARYQEICHAAEGAGAIVHNGTSIETGDELGISADVRFEVLLIERASDELADPNLVLGVRYDETFIAFTGDIGPASQDAIAAANGGCLHADIITLPCLGHTSYNLTHYFDYGTNGLAVYSNADMPYLIGWTYMKQCERYNLGACDMLPLFNSYYSFIFTTDGRQLVRQ